MLSIGFYDNLHSVYRYQSQAEELLFLFPCVIPYSRKSCHILIIKCDHINTFGEYHPFQVLFCNDSIEPLDKTRQWKNIWDIEDISVMCIPFFFKIMNVSPYINPA